MFSLLILKFRTSYLLLSILIFLTACSTRQPQLLNQATIAEEKFFFTLLDNEYDHWKGTPYRFGGASKKGVDCSALVQAIYLNSFNIGIARTASRQAKLGFFVERDALQVADLLFFKTAWKEHHVGIYLGEKLFLHASTSNGVIISSLDNVYWASKFWQARRIID